MTLTAFDALDDLLDASDETALPEAPAPDVAKTSEPHAPETPVTATPLKSIKGRAWTVASADPAQTRAIVQTGITPQIAPILAARGLDAEGAKRFMQPEVARDVPQASDIEEMTAAAETIVAAMRAGTQIAVYGDYDVDGATSTAIMVRAIRRHGRNARIYIPDRFSEGYGPNVAAIEKLAHEGYGLIVFVDSGTIAHASLDRAAELGVGTVVVDHHAPGDSPRANTAALVNPNCHAATAELYGHMCAAGLAWVLAREIDRMLGGSGVDDLLDLAALGTVADVVPLTGPNRALVSAGLKVMNRRGNPGLSALADKAAVAAPFKASHCGFALGPRVNAGGRVGESTTGARLLSSDDAATCADLAASLDAWNRERQTIERECKDLSLAQAEANGGSEQAVIFTEGENWHEGVVGIVASRLKDAYDRPSFVFSIRDGKMVGSARSMPGFDIGACVHAARERGLLDKGGGHKMAAGMSTTPDRYEAFKAFVEEAVRASEFWETGPVAEHDLEISPDQMHPALAEPLEGMAPFGMGAPRPRVIVRDARVARIRVMDDKKTGEPAHMKVEMATARGSTVCAVAFHIAGTPLFEALRAAEGQTVDISGSLSVNEFRGQRSVEISLEDARLT